MPKEISRKLSLYTFIFTMIIVNYHWGTTFSEYTDIFPVYGLFAKISDFSGIAAMAYFFFISGYLLYRNADQMNWKRKIYSRICSLLIPYILWNCICYFSGNWRDAFSTPLTLFLRNLVVNPYDGPLWYMLGIFILLVFFPICVRQRIILLFIPIAFKMIEPVLPDSIWWLGNLIYYLPNYCLGAFLGSADKHKESVSVVQALISIFFITASFFICLTTPSKSCIYQAILLIFPILCWCVLPESIMSDDLPFPLTISFFLYAMHAGDVIPILRSRIMPLFFFIMNCDAGIIAARIIMLLLTYIVILILTCIMKRILPAKVFGLLSGNRVH